MGVILHGNFRKLFIGTSAEHPVDLTQESTSEVDRYELFMIGFPDEQHLPRRIQRPALQDTLVASNYSNGPVWIGGL